MSSAVISLATVAELAGLAQDADWRSARTFTRLAAFDDATADAIVFAQDERSLENALQSRAGLILAPLPATPIPNEDPRVLRCRHPKHAFARCAEWLEQFAEPVIHPRAVVDAGATLGPGCSVGAGAVIESGAVLGACCVIAANATIHGCCRLGDRVLVQAGAVLGGLGFGYVRGADGRYVRFPQQGVLVVEDEVEIGANTTIDRGALGETRIGRGTKIDNLVQVGHNCRIGANVVIASQVGISGSTVIEDGAILAGQVGLGDHVHIGPGVILGGQAGVYPGKSVTGPGEMFAGTPAEPVREYLKSMARVRRLK